MPFALVNASPEVLEKERSADHQHDGQCHLPRDKSDAKAAAPHAPAGLGAVLEGVREIDPTRFEGGGETEQDAGQHRDH
jgi:hypothetical protein